MYRITRRCRVKSPRILAVISLLLWCTIGAVGQTSQPRSSGPPRSGLPSTQLPEHPRPQPPVRGRCGRQVECAPSPPCCVYPRPSYPPTWFGPDEGHHAAVGALVGFTVLGVAGGLAAQTDNRSKVAAGLFVGSLGALVGAAVGHTIPSARKNHWHHRYPASDDEEMAESRSAPGKSVGERTP